MKFLLVWIAFPLSLSYLVSKRRYVQIGGVTKYVLRIQGSRCRAKIEGDTTVGPTTTGSRPSFTKKILTWLSRPRSSSMMKKRIAHRVGRGIMDTALG